MGEHALTGKFLHEPHRPEEGQEIGESHLSGTGGKKVKDAKGGRHKACLLAWALCL